MRTFTVSQAKRLIPILQRELNKLQPAYDDLKRYWIETADKNGLEIEDPKVRDFCMQDRGARDAIEQVETSLALFDDLGVECKGIEDGIFDFPCLLEDRFVFLSWHVDEEDVDHWHELDSGFHGRKPLTELSCTPEGTKEILIN